MLHVNYLILMEPQEKAFSPSKSVSHEPVGTETEKDDEWNRRRAEGVARNSRPYKLKLAINMSVNVGRFMGKHMNFR